MQENCEVFPLLKKCLLMMTLTKMHPSGIYVNITHKPRVVSL